jgi:endothelin-converting enzyme/putative endopeptidase
MIRHTAALLLASFFALTATSRAADAPAAATPTPGPGFDVAHIDRAALPCTDFYQFACGTWLAKNPTPPDQPSWNRGFELYLRNGATLRGILESDKDKIGDDYAACMDEAGIEALGLKPLETALAAIDGMKSKADLPRVVAQLHRLGADAVFSFGAEQDFKDASVVIAWLDQGGLGLPDRDYYLKDDERSTGLRKAYTAHVAKMLELAGATPEKGAADAAAIVALETALAKASMDRVARRDPAALYHPTPRKELRALAPEFHWEGYFEELGAPAFERLNVGAPDFVKGLGEPLRTLELPAWKAYLRWHVLHSSYGLLPKAFVDEGFAFYGATLKGAKQNRPRWQRCMANVERHLGEALGRRFVEKTFGEEGKARVLAMVTAIRATLDRSLKDLPWMTEKTRKEAGAKLQAIATRIGYPDAWRDYSALVIKRNEALGNDQRASAFEVARGLAKIGKAPDKNEWPFPPTAMNAGYEALVNTITFSAAMLQPPFYENRLDDAVNMGAIGAVIGHELTHGFDDQGRKFDAQGLMRDWWTAEDAAEFEKRAACFVDQYAAYKILEDAPLNGKLTLGENTADNGGVRLAFHALASLPAAKAAPIDGFTPEQRFFLGFGQIACENRSPESYRMMTKVDPHSPGRFRVNGVVSNMPEFARAFGCKAGAPMVREPICRVW